MYRNLEKIRKQKGLTIENIAKIIHRSPANYYKKEKGTVSITIKEALLIANFLNEKIEYLFKEY